ncbi:MAG: TetR/AcrR family transcriptional regulator [Deltaproteobacteria bacterium]|nr:TetR/AcrR family transcriptional regulator [Deltaproteobacteria bacterium]
MEGRKLPRRERDKLRQRREILTAALGLFAQKGYHNVSMHEVAGKSEFSIGTLYKFFPNKEELYRELVVEESDRFHSEMVRVLEGPGDELERLREYIRAKGEIFEGSVTFIRLFLAETWGPSLDGKGRPQEEVMKRRLDILDRLAAIFAEGVEKGRFRALGAPHHLAVALDSTINGFLLLGLGQEPFRYPEDPSLILDIFLKGLIKS